VALKYQCELCDYTCSKKYNWDKHILTRKHQQATNGNTLATEKWQKEQLLCCEQCGKEYHNRTGLWRHNNKGNCISTSTNTEQIKTEEIN
jgi:uncharacterized C2H2 Zn-finger protein